MDRKVVQFAPYLGDEEYRAIKQCFDRNWITEGPQSKIFHDRLLELVGARYGVFAPNGTLALYLALRAMGIGQGDEVVVPDFTFMGSASAVEMAGAVPVFCDINPDTLQVEASHIERVIGDRTRAIMPVHIYGMACEISPIMELARKSSVMVIEDAAQAIGVLHQGKHAGTFGDTGCFSFFADKTITTGEGGLIVTADEKIHESLLYLRNQGRINRGSFIHPQLGYNFRITDIQAAIGNVQLDKLNKIKTIKLEILTRYRERLGSVREIRFITVPPNSNIVPFRIAIYVENNPGLTEYMSSRGIEIRTFFYPLHRQPAFEYLKTRPESARQMRNEAFPGANYAYDNGVCLPSYPGISEDDIDYICATIREFYGRN